MPTGKIGKFVDLIARPPLFLFLVSLAVFGLYVTSIDLKLYADDFAIWNTVKQAPDLASLFATTYVPEFYRPFELSLIHLNIELFGFNPIGYHLFTICGHILACLLLYKLGLCLGLPRSAAMLASLFFGLAHVNAISVMSNDAAGQIYSVCLGMLVMIVLLSPRKLRLSHGLIAGGIYFFLLLWKDSGAAFGAAAILILGWRFLPKKQVRRFILYSLPILVTLLVYIGIRHHVGIQSPGFGTESRYQFWIGFNVIKNIAYLFAAMLTPIGTTLLVSHRGDPVFITIAAVGILADILVLVTGLWLFGKNDKGDKKRIALPILILLVLLLPDCLLNHVAEMYAYKPFTLFALLFAVALIQIDLWARKKEKRFRSMILLFVVLTLSCHVVSVKHKEHLMRHNGRLANRMLQEIKSQVPQIPSNTPVLVSNLDSSPELTYSIFYMNGVVLLGGGGYIEMLYGHKPIDYRKVSPDQLKLRLADLQQPTLVITYGEGKVTALLLEGSAEKLWF